jgi:Raf kinase inhibitor-like YbhB/YbcL family protein
VEAFTLTSTAFAHGDPIPQRHTCEDVDHSPPLAWTDPPEGTRSLFLVCDDADARGGTFTHWLAWGWGPTAGALAEGQAAPQEGRNDFGTEGYRGPCPPRGHGPHRYSFRLYALDAELDLPSGTEKGELERALEGHSLGVAELLGTFERS